MKQEVWFEAGVAEMKPAIATMRSAFLQYKKDPWAETLEALRAARKDAQRIARRCVKDYWIDLYQDIQFSADLGNVRRMYEGMKRALEPNTVRSA